MNYAAFQKYEFPSSPQNIASKTPKKRRLTAQWLTVDASLFAIVLLLRSDINHFFKIRN